MVTYRRPEGALGEVAKIRRYRPEDRDAVRYICCETGHLGDPIDPYFGDREVFADLVTSYYTDYESDWIFVAELHGRVVGYLTGCPDTRRYRQHIPRIAKAVVAKALLRAVVLCPSTAPMAARVIADSLRERPRLGWYGPEYPAHLHIDFLPEARGLGLGRALMELYLCELEAIGVPGVFLETSCENRRAVAFFASCGFEPLNVTLSPGGRAADGSRLHVLALGRRLA